LMTCKNLLSPLWMLGTDEMKTQEVSEGDSVTLHTGITEPQKYDQILWSFGPRGSVIAQIPERTSKTSFRDDERFRGRLQLDSETGDLTIRDVKITQSGDYQLKLIRARQTKSRKFKLILYGEQLTQYNNSIESVELQRDDQILWTFGSEDTVIAKRERNANQTADADGRFGDRLQMDDQTGSLSITNTKSTDSGVYHLHISSRNKVSYKKFRVTWTQ
uniref:Immunoglobulin domain-containing protein n=1 Tax=Cyprinus carpio TaxID=7962 RepID=A0A8C1QU26_CYPCA